MPEPREVAQMRRAEDLTCPTPLRRGERVLVWIEGVVLDDYIRENPDGTVEHVATLDFDRLRAAMVVSS